MEFKNILVDVDADAEWHPALEQAIDLARYSGARLRIVDVVRDDDRKDSLSAAKAQWMASLRKRLEEFGSSATGLEVTHELLVGRRRGFRLIEEVLRRGHDLLVRSHVRDLTAADSKGYGAVDMQLFRKCPCPVWAVGPGAEQRPARIAVAVNANPDDAEEQELNVKIVEVTLQMARLEANRVYVVQAWMPYGEQVLRGRSSREELTAYIEDTRRASAAAFEEFTSQFGARLAGATFTLEKGFPQDVLPAYVADRGIDLVVMGTVARVGVPGLLMGNTAEQMLRKLWCSILAVKPDGFESPVRLPGS
jgi:nucleotide-binding universal stress UspA family protein